MDEDHGDERALVGEMADAVRATRQANSARVLVARSDDGPRPTAANISGEGLVDFANDRVWLANRAITPAMARDLKKQGGLLRRTFARWGGRRRETFFEGDARATQNRSGRWRELMPLPPWKTTNPLWMLGPLARLRAAPEEQAHETVRDVSTTRYSISFTTTEMPASAWEWIADPGVPSPPPPGSWRERHGPVPQARDRVPGVIWIDELGRIRRMAFENSRIKFRGDEEVTSTWEITEFWDFGLDIDRERPPLPPASDMPSYFREKNERDEEEAKRRTEVQP